MVDVRADVRRFIEDNFIMGTLETPLGDADSFLDHHVLDSTGFLELVHYLEHSYGIVVDSEEMIPENLDSVDCVVQFVERKRGA